jgi:predicted nucleic acid-binding protein
VGILLDSTFFVDAERSGLSARQALARFSLRFPAEQTALSVITLAELAHGLARADTPPRRAARQRFIDELMKSIPTMPVTAAVALRAGELDGQNKARGIHVALADLLIGARALGLGYKVATTNFRDFQEIPGLEIISV